MTENPKENNLDPVLARPIVIAVGMVLNAYAPAVARKIESLSLDQMITVINEDLDAGLRIPTKEEPVKASEFIYKTCVAIYKKRQSSN